MGRPVLLVTPASLELHALLAVPPSLIVRIVPKMEPHVVPAPLDSSLMVIHVIHAQLRYLTAWPVLMDPPVPNVELASSGTHVPLVAPL